MGLQLTVRHGSCTHFAGALSLLAFPMLLQPLVRTCSSSCGTAERNHSLFIVFSCPTQMPSTLLDLHAPAQAHDGLLQVPLWFALAASKSLPTRPSASMKDASTGVANVCVGWVEGGEGCGGNVACIATRSCVTHDVLKYNIKSGNDRVLCVCWGWGLGGFWGGGFWWFTSW